MSRSRRLFVDTGVLIAAVVADDPDHDAAGQIVETRREWHSLVTSDYVLAEGLNFIRRKVRREDVASAFLALAFGEGEDAPLIQSVLRVHGTRFAAALDRYRREFDRGLSFTDWTSVVLMEEERIGAIATFDAGFRGLADVVP